MRDLVGSISRPVRELASFQRVTLEPGESRRLCFEVPLERLTFTGPDLRPCLEPGDFTLWIGPDALLGS